MMISPCSNTGSEQEIIWSWFTPECHSAWKGKGIGALLARTALEYARQHELRVVPLCSFVQTYLQRHPEFADLVDTQKR